MESSEHIGKIVLVDRRRDPLPNVERFMIGGKPCPRLTLIP